MRLRLSGSLALLARRFGGAFARIIPNRQGNIAMTFGLIAMPLLLGVGVSIDYVRAYNVRVKMQSDLDAALIASVKKVDSLDEADIKKHVGKWFAAQANDNQASYALMLDTMVISKTNKSIQAIATGVVPTTFLGLVNIHSVNVSVTTSVAGPATQYLNVYLVLDKSASMMLAATSAGQTTMRTVTTLKNQPCVFACHEPEGQKHVWKGITYDTNYDLAKALGIDLRADISVKAAKEVLAMIDAADPTHTRIKVGLYSIGGTAKEVLKPTFSTSDATKALSDDRLTSATSEDTTRFDNSLPALAKAVGKGGDGSTTSTPRKLVLLLTDGVQSERPWVMSNDHNKTSPMNAAWCNSVKRVKPDNVDLGILYTEYLPMSWDEGYSRTLDLSLKSSTFESEWDGEIPKDVSPTITRHDFIPMTLQACASAPELFLSAASPAEIESGLSKIFQQYLGSVRLTQ